MGHPYVLANAFRVRLADWLFGCSHRRTTFPITLPASVGVNGQQSTRSETYIACLECGRHFAYDWTTMRIVSPWTAWVGARQVQGSISDKKDGLRCELRVRHAVTSGFHEEAEANRGAQ